MISRLRQWCARPLLDDLQAQHRAAVNDLSLRMQAEMQSQLQRACWQSYQQGYAEGEMKGRTEAAESVQDWIAQRGDTGPVADDLARLRRLN